MRIFFERLIRLLIEWLEGDEVENKRSVSMEEAKRIGKQLGLDWYGDRVIPEEFRMGLEVELEHGRIHPLTNITDDDMIKTGKIALAHLMFEGKQPSRYYTELKKMEDRLAGNTTELGKALNACEQLRRMSRRNGM